MICKTVKINDASLTLYILSNSSDINANRRRPLVIICPGGGYSFCSDREAEPVAVKFCSFGFNTAVLRYTCNKNKDINSPVYPKPQEELAKAISYLRNNADKLNTDKEMIITLGFSAGAHLVGSIGCLWQQFNYNSRPNAQVLCYPVITSGEYSHKGSFDLLCGNDDTLKKKLSLEFCVNGSVPPTFIWHTKTDNSVPVENSLLFKKALDNAGIENKLVLFEEGNHGLSLATKEVCNAKHNTTNSDVAVWPELVRDWIMDLFGDSWY